jgi:hypothetical protein
MYLVGSAEANRMHASGKAEQGTGTAGVEPRRRHKYSSSVSQAHIHERRDQYLNRNLKSFQQAHAQGFGK